MEAITTALVLLCLFFMYKCIYLPRPKNFPPGPDGLPIIGCLIPIVRSPLSAFHKWAEEYGNVFSVKIGPMYVVICHKLEANREALAKKGDAFAGRPKMFIQSVGTDGNGIITRPYDNGLIDQKKFVLRTLLYLGRKGDSLEIRIQKEALQLCENMRSRQCTPTKIIRLLQLGTSNVIFSIAFGKRFHYKDESLTYLLDQLDEQFSQNPFKYLLQIARFLPKPIRKRMSFIDLAKPTEKVASYMENIINQRKKIFDPENYNDLLDAFLQNEEKRKSGMYCDDKETFESFTEEQLTFLLFDFFLAGTETTATTLNWAVLYMIRNPKVQERVQDELDEILGKDPSAVISLRDRAALPYTSATLLEIQRIRPVAPLGSPHSAVKASTLGGYDIPKDTILINDLWSVHMDDKFWTEPNTFNPNRMLDDNGHVITPEAFLPFSTGPRVCLGEQVAKTELFIFFCTMMHRFHFEIPPGESRPTDEPHVGIALTPKSYKVCFRLRR